MVTKGGYTLYILYKEMDVIMENNLWVQEVEKLRDIIIMEVYLKKNWSESEWRRKHKNKGYHQMISMG